MEPWLALEHIVLLWIGCLAVGAVVLRGRRPASQGALVGAAALGAAFFIWLEGVRLIVPTEHWWVFKLDWRWHFLGWHMFRHEPWHLPPGRIDGYGAPIGTSIGLTDSIPVAALVLKPFNSLLSMPFQNLGLWLFLCFVLQGVVGALLARLWTRNTLVQVLGGGCFVLMPTLLIRDIHAALCAHWLLLWALWLYFLTDRDGRVRYLQIGALALIAGLTHPYLATMVAALLGALAVRLLVPWIFDF